MRFYYQFKRAELCQVAPEINHLLSRAKGCPSRLQAGWCVVSSLLAVPLKW